MPITLNPTFTGYSFSPLTGVLAPPPGPVPDSFVALEIALSSSGIPTAIIQGPWGTQSLQRITEACRTEETPFDSNTLSELENMLESLSPDLVRLHNLERSLADRCLFHNISTLAAQHHRLSVRHSYLSQAVQLLRIRFDGQVQPDEMDVEIGNRLRDDIDHLKRDIREMPQRLHLFTCQMVRRSAEGVGSLVSEIMSEVDDLQYHEKIRQMENLDRQLRQTISQIEKATPTRAIFKSPVESHYAYHSLFSKMFENYVKQYTWTCDGEGTKLGFLRQVSSFVEGILDVYFWDPPPSKEVFQDFLQAAFHHYRNFPYKGGGYSALSHSSMRMHFLIGSHPTAGTYIQEVTDNLRAYPKIFGRMTGDLFYRRGRLVSELKNVQGQPTGFFLVIERGHYESHNGLQIAIFEESPLPTNRGRVGYVSKIGVHLSPNKLRIVNAQNLSNRALGDILDYYYSDYCCDRLDRVVTKAKEKCINPKLVFDGLSLLRKARSENSEWNMEGGEKVDEKLNADALQGAIQRQRQRFRDHFGAAPLDVLTMIGVFLGKSWGLEALEGIKDQAQQARAEEVRNGSLQPGFYDLLFRRFGFETRAREDWWALNLSSLEIHRKDRGTSLRGKSLSFEEYAATILPRSNRVRPGEWDRQTPDQETISVIAFQRSILPALAQMHWDPIGTEVEVPTDTVDLTNITKSAAY